VPKALLVTSSFLPGRGGMESYLAELCDELGNEIAVLAPGKRGHERLPSDLEYQTIAGAGKMLWPGPRVTRAIETAARSLNVDKILFGTPWPLALTGPRLSRKGFRYSVIVHGAELMVPAALPFLKRRMAQSLTGADELFAVSTFTKVRITRLLESTRNTTPPIRLLRATVDLERFRPDIDTTPMRARLAIPEEHKVLLCFGRLVKRKGVHRVIEVLDEISARGGPVTLLVGGTGPELGRLQRLAQNVRARVEFLGRVSEEDAPSLYALADIFVLPVVDRWFGLEVEGLGIVLVEAAAAGTPCITGTSGGTPEAVIDGETGFVIDAREPRQLIDRAVLLLGEPHTAAAMGLKGREHVRQQFAGSDQEALKRWLSAGLTMPEPRPTPDKEA
jgi:phosphatidylinositol alpha-1,6-mannosyltransferase